MLFKKSLMFHGRFAQLHKIFSLQNAHRQIFKSQSFLSYLDNKFITTKNEYSTNFEYEKQYGNDRSRLPIAWDTW
jgi:hypothetical protein